MIMVWAGVWSRTGNVIPRFVQVEENASAEIRVKFTGRYAIYRMARNIGGL